MKVVWRETRRLPGVAVVWKAWTLRKSFELLECR
jgi:hypothetical protein